MVTLDDFKDVLQNTDEKKIDNTLEKSAETSKEETVQKETTITEEVKPEVQKEENPTEGLKQEDNNEEKVVCKKCFDIVTEDFQGTECKRCNEIADNREKIITLLKSTKRENIDKLIQYMDNRGFFTSPASSKYHGNYPGALSEHCLNIYNTFKHLQPFLDAKLEEENLIICAFCHDLCKVGSYNVTQDGKISYNKEHPKGHALISLQRTKQFIELTDEEKQIITYHMGMYGSKEFSVWSSEYSLKELGDIYSQNKIVKMFYFCDDLSAQFLEKMK